ncbi:hypothetical protein N9M16_01905 [Candidatus Dependentiae bacterium]|nr:hypothetical protein [Candidatus Dependentiae bacterium]
MKAIFFDLDDTLVLTSEIDIGAHHIVGEVASILSPGIVVERLVADFKEEFQREPWDPEYIVEVNEWRARLWARALTRQSVSHAASLGIVLQVCSRNHEICVFPYLYPAGFLL